MIKFYLFSFIINLCLAPQLILCSQADDSAILGWDTNQGIDKGMILNKKKDGTPSLVISESQPDLNITFNKGFFASEFDVVIHDLASNHDSSHKINSSLKLIKTKHFEIKNTDTGDIFSWKPSCHYTRTNEFRTLADCKGSRMKVLSIKGNDRTIVEIPIYLTCKKRKLNQNKSKCNLYLTYNHLFNEERNLTLTTISASHQLAHGLKNKNTSPITEKDLHLGRNIDEGMTYLVHKVNGITLGELKINTDVDNHIRTISKTFLTQGKLNLEEKFETSSFECETFTRSNLTIHLTTNKKLLTEAIKKSSSKSRVSKGESKSKRPNNNESSSDEELGEELEEEELEVLNEDELLGFLNSIQ